VLEELENVLDEELEESATLLSPNQFPIHFPNHWPSQAIKLLYKSKSRIGALLFPSLSTGEVTTSLVSAKFLNLGPSG